MPDKDLLTASGTLYPPPHFTDEKTESQAGGVTIQDGTACEDRPELNPGRRRLAMSSVAITATLQSSVCSGQVASLWKWKAVFHNPGCARFLRNGFWAARDQCLRRRDCGVAAVVPAGRHSATRTAWLWHRAGCCLGLLELSRKMHSMEALSSYLEACDLPGWLVMGFHE